jgi:hypothetical protein
LLLPGRPYEFGFTEFAYAFEKKQRAPLQDLPKEPIEP